MASVPVPRLLVPPISTSHPHPSAPLAVLGKEGRWGRKDGGKEERERGRERKRKGAGEGETREENEKKERGEAGPGVRGMEGRREEGKSYLDSSFVASSVLEVHKERDRGSEGLQPAGAGIRFWGGGL